MALRKSIRQESKTITFTMDINNDEMSEMDVYNYSDLVSSVQVQYFASIH